MPAARRFSWIWKSLVASACGTLAHMALMAFKERTGLLREFDPSQAIQHALSAPLAAAIPPGTVPWVLSQLNGAALIGLLFGRFFNHLPGRSGLAKGLILGIAGWLMLGAILFPAIGLGPFAWSVGRGFGPGVFSLAMIEAYSLVLGLVYAALQEVDDRS